MCKNRRVCGVRHVPVVVVVGTASVCSLALERRLAITIGVAAAAPGPTAAIVEAVVEPIFGLDDFESFVGELSCGDDVDHHVDSVFRAVEQNGDRLKISDSETVVEGGLPESGYVVAVFDRRKVVVQAVGHNWPKEVLLIHPVRGFDLSDFGAGLCGIGQEDVEHEVNVDGHVILGGAVFTHMEGARGEGPVCVLGDTG